MTTNNTKAKLTANPALTGNWKARHNDAVDWPTLRFETPVVQLLKAWQMYAKDHQTRYDSPVGEDGVLGVYWREVGLCLRGLLNGDVGPRLDCGTLDAFILGVLAENGVSTEGL